MARMSSGLAAGLGVLLLGAGFGIGVFVAGQGGADPERIVVVGEARPSVAAPAAVPAAGAGDSTAEPASTGSEREAVRRLLESLPPLEVPRGSGVITGTVVKEDGSPLAGVEVTLQPEQPRDPRAAASPPGEEPDLETVVLGNVRSVRWWKTARETATSGADGRFRFDGVADVAHQTGAKLRGWRITARDWNIANKARPGADLEFVATPEIEVTVEIALADGTVPEQAQVRAVQGTNSSGYGWGRGSPVVRMKPGTFQVHVTAGEEEEYRSEPQTVVLEKGAEPPTLSFVVRGRPGIRGKVTLEGFTSPRGVYVTLARIPADGRADPALLSGPTAQSTSAHGNSYSFTDLAPGRYLVGAGPGHRGPPSVCEEVEVAGDLVRKDLVVSSVDTTRYAILFVQGPDGSPLTVSGVTTGYRSGSSSSSGGGGWLRRADGAWLVEHQDTSGIGGETAAPDAVWWVDIQTESHGSRKVEYRRVPDTQVTVRFEDPSSLEVTITGLRGSPLEGALQASLVPASEGNQPYFRGGRNQNRLDAEGRVTIAGIQPGDYLLVLTGAGDRGEMRPLSRTPVTVRSGRNSLSVPVPVLHRVTVSGAEGAARLSRTGEMFWRMSGTADAEGRVVFEGLPEGNYSVQSGSKNQEFQVPGTTDVKL